MYLSIYYELRITYNLKFKFNVSQVLSFYYKPTCVTFSIQLTDEEDNGGGKI